MTAFADYYDLVEPLRLPIRGKTYEIPPIGASDVVRWRRYADKVGRLVGGENIEILPEEVITDEQFRRMFLGSALDQMLTDDVHDGVIEHAARTALGDTMGGREVAERMWNSIDPKASKPTPAPEKDSTPSPSTDAATTTNSPARTTGTKSRRTSQASARQRTGTKSSTGSTSSRSTSSGTSASD